MSRENVELHRRVNAAFSARDVEGIVALCDQQVEFHSLFVAVGDTVYRGHDGILAWHRDLQDAWGEAIRIEAEAYFEVGEHTVAFNVLHGRGRHSGAEVTMPYAQIVQWHDALMVHFKAYAHREDALGDLGVSADDLEPIAP
jgi:ketosteroid isomerase-like protein